MPLFRSNSKSPKEVVSELRETLLFLTQPQAAAEGKWHKKHRSSSRASRKNEQSDADLTKAAGEECASLLSSLTNVLLADSQTAAGSFQNSQLSDEVVRQCYDADLLLYLVRTSLLEELPSPKVNSISSYTIRVYRCCMSIAINKKKKTITEHESAK